MHTSAISDREIMHDEDLRFDRLALTSAKLTVALQFAAAAAKGPELEFNEHQISELNVAFARIAEELEVHPDAPESQYLDLSILQAACKKAEAKNIPTDNRTFDALTALYLYMREEKRKYDESAEMKAGLASVTPAVA